MLLYLEKIETRSMFFVNIGTQSYILYEVMELQKQRYKYYIFADR